MQLEADKDRATRAADTRDLYLDLLERSLSAALQEQALYPVAPTPGGLKQRVYVPIRRFLASRGLVLARSVSIRPETFSESPPPPIPVAETMIGPLGLQNVRACVEDVLDQRVPGDLIEAGVWRGGATVYMRALLEAYGDRNRMVWAADSFHGLPSPEQSGYNADIGEEYWSKAAWLDAPLERVKRTFERYGLLDERVRFLVGWFADTLPEAPIEQLALIRIDADMYGSTMDALKALYPRLSVGGYVIIDDYWLPNCKTAVDEYRREHGIDDELIKVDRAVVYWRRSR